MSRRQKPALFNGFWLDLDGKRIRKIHRDEYAELYRLWREHRGIREGRVRAT